MWTERSSCLNRNIANLVEIVAVEAAYIFVDYSFELWERLVYFVFDYA